MTRTPRACWEAAGRGTIDHLGCHGRVDIQVGTLSKAIGSIGGYVCGSRDLIEFLYQRARPFLFSTSHPPSVTATCQAAFALLDSAAGDRLVKKLWSNTKFFKRPIEKSLVLTRARARRPLRPSWWAMRKKAFPVFAGALLRRLVRRRPRFSHRSGGKAR